MIGYLSQEIHLAMLWGDLAFRPIRCSEIHVTQPPARRRKRVSYASGLQRDVMERQHFHDQFSA